MRFLRASRDRDSSGPMRGSYSRPCLPLYHFRAVGWQSGRALEDFVLGADADARQIRLAVMAPDCSYTAITPCRRPAPGTQREYGQDQRTSATTSTAAADLSPFL